MADQRIQLDIVTPEKIAFTGEVVEITLPGAQGEFGVLPGHTFFLSELKVGPMHFIRGGQIQYFALNRGIAEVTPTKVTVLVTTAENKADVDVERAEAAQARAEQRLRDREGDIDMARAEAALQRSLARLKVAKF
jgi:F-type H+-transporting ATPase subunit epsilon